MRPLVCVIMLVILQAIGFSATINVPGNYSTIQAAIDAAANGDTVTVAPGTYVENIFFSGKEVYVESSLGAAATIIDGSSPSNPDYGSVAAFIQAGSSRLVGFTLTNGTGYLSGGDHRGGGVFCYASWAKVANCIITGNTASNLGGGVHFDDSNAIIDGCLICNNHAGGSGGGTSGYYYSDDHYFNCIISNNTASSRGGGAYVRFLSVASFTGCTFYGNSAGSGGGLMTDFNADVTLMNDIFWANSPQQIYLGEDKGGTTGAVSYCDVQGGQSGCFVAPTSSLFWGANNINADPLFAETNAQDFHIRYDSACKDVGNNTGVGFVDFEGDPRIAEGTVDIGADEFYRHLYHLEPVVPGNLLTLKVVGTPSAPVILALGASIKDLPVSTQYGDLWLNFPLMKFQLGAIPSDGILGFSATVPNFWLAGQQKPLQALVGPLGNPASMLTNLDVLVVE